MIRQYKLQLGEAKARRRLGRFSWIGTC